jgi:hypothetical protein
MPEEELWFNGVEPVEIGNLDDVKEQRTVIPATKGVRVKIKKADNAINKDNTYRSINLQLQITQGIDETGKYKNKVIFGRVCYYADPNAYTKDFFKTKQHLVQLKYLARATGMDFSKITGEFIDSLVTAPEIKVDITIRKRKMLVDGVEEETMENEVKNYKSLDPTELI